MDEKRIERLVKDCPFSDYSTNWKVYVCLLIDPILGSGTQCIFLTNFHLGTKEDLPEKCPNNKI